jgi:serine/threonine protein kinase
MGQQLGNYRIIRPIGHGGFSDVYLGQHLFLNSYAAVKVLHVVLNDKQVKDFLTEAQTQARLTHPHIVRIFDFAVEADIPFLVMDYLPNGTLRQRHPMGSSLPLDTIVSYVKQIAEALQYAHDHYVIHRDVKPENMLLGPHNEVILTDFGIATIAHNTLSMSTQNGAGTIAYMAPEQINRKPQPASDQYALGIVTYEWLCGEYPFNGTIFELYNQHLPIA